MFYVLVEIVLLAILATSCGMLYRVTYPACRNRHCNHNH